MRGIAEWRNTARFQIQMPPAAWAKSAAFAQRFFALNRVLTEKLPSMRVEVPLDHPIRILAILLQSSCNWFLSRPKVAVVLDDVSGVNAVSARTTESPFLKLLVARRHLNVFYTICIVHAPSFIFGRAKTQIDNFCLFDGIEPAPLATFLKNSVPIRSVVISEADFARNSTGLHELYQ